MTIEPTGSDHLATLEWSENAQLWIGDGAFQDTSDLVWGAAALELTEAPRAVSDKDQADRSHQMRQVATQIVRSLHAWRNAGGLEVRYLWGGQAAGESLRVVLISRAFGRSLPAARSWASSMLQTVTSMFPSGYVFGGVRGAASAHGGAWMEVERSEEIRSPAPFVSPDLVSYYYLLHPLGGSGSAWPKVPAALSRLTSPGFLSIALVPTSLTQDERNAIDQICTLAQHLSRPQSGYDFFGNARETPADFAAGEVYRCWSRFPSNDGVLARIGIATDHASVRSVATLVASSIADGNVADDELPRRFKLVSGVQSLEALVTAQTGLVLPRYDAPVWQLPPDQIPISVERMPYFFSEDEAGGLFVLPVPDEQGVSGMAASRPAGTRRGDAGITPPDVAAAVRIGRRLSGGQETTDFGVPLRYINRHTLVVGASGWGKTTTIKTTLTDLWRRHRIPFLVIEPRKLEYRDLLAVDGFEDLRVITIGRDDISPVRINILAPPAGVRCENHAGRVASILRLALPLGHPIPSLLPVAIERAYRKAGWDEDTILEDGLPPPSLRDLAGTFDEVFFAAGYRGEALNVGTAFQVRLRGLLAGSRGRVLDTVESSDPKEWLQYPAVIEMDQAEADDVGIFSALFLQHVRAAANRRGRSRTLQHVTVLEEAHAILGQSEKAGANGGDGDRLQADAMTAWCEAIAELRASGEGFILSSNSPSGLVPAALPNTSLRILQHTESAKERNVVLDDADATPAVRALAADLGEGIALVRTPDAQEMQLIRIKPSRDILDEEAVATDEDVRVHMAAHAAQTRRLMPFGLCTRQVCLAGCDPDVRRRGRQLAGRLGPQIDTARKDAAGLPTLTDLWRQLDSEAGRSLQLTYCAAAHLATDGEPLATDILTTLRTRASE